MSGGEGRPLRVVQVNVQMDELRRDPDALLAAWRTIPDVADAARGAGVSVTVFQAASRDEVLEWHGVRYVFVRERPPSAARLRVGPWAAPGRRALAARAALLDADVVHLHGLAFPLHARSLGRVLGAPVLAQDRGNTVPRAWRRPVDRIGFRRLAGALFTSREQAEPWFRAGVLPSGLPVHEVLGSSSRFRPGDRGEARAATGLTGDPCVLWVSRLTSVKDPLTALEGVRRAASALPGLRLWLCHREAPAHPTPLLADVRRRIAADPVLADRVHLLGEVPHARIEILCRAADLFLATSRYEATGFALLEALACGLPPVVTDIPAFRRITGGRVGAHFACGDAGALADALAACAGRGGEGPRGAVRAHFERELSFEALGRQLRAAYEAAYEAASGAAKQAPNQAPNRAPNRAAPGAAGRP